MKSLANHIIKLGVGRNRTKCHPNLSRNSWLQRRDVRHYSCSKFNKFRTNLAATSFIPKTLEKCHDKNQSMYQHYQRLFWSDSVTWLFTIYLICCICTVFLEIIVPLAAFYFSLILGVSELSSLAEFCSVDQKYVSTRKSRGRSVQNHELSWFSHMYLSAYLAVRLYTNETLSFGKI